MKNIQRDGYGKTILHNNIDFTSYSVLRTTYINIQRIQHYIPVQRTAYINITYNVQTLTYNIQRTMYINIQHTTLPTTYNVLLTNMQQTTYNVQHAKQSIHCTACRAKHSLYNMQSTAFTVHYEAYVIHYARFGQLCTLVWKVRISICDY